MDVLWNVFSFGKEPGSLQADWCLLSSLGGRSVPVSDWLVDWQRLPGDG